MSDDQEFDLCECVFSHEFAMRRLLSLVSKEKRFNFPHSSRVSHKK